MSFCGSLILRCGFCAFESYLFGNAIKDIFRYELARGSINSVYNFLMHGYGGRVGCEDGVGVSDRNGVAGEIQQLCMARRSQVDLVCKPGGV